MIVTREQLKEITGVDYYDGSIIHNRFAYKFFRDKTHPVGNIITFVSPTVVEADNMIDLEDVITKDFIYSDSMINFCFELPTTNLWGGVAFQRLYNSLIGNILADIIKKPVEIDGDDIFVNVKLDFDGDGDTERKKSSVSIVTEKNGAILGHTGININAGARAPSFAYSTNMSVEQVAEFQKKCIEAFYQTVHSIFIATTKVI
ncbi:MAG: DUF366 family protein [Clostridia bacterium]|nr:DUF366 family protein [Clostridia bacterium]